MASIKKLVPSIIDFGLRNREFDTFAKKVFPGETFRVLKEKEEKQFGEYTPAAGFGNGAEIMQEIATSICFFGSSLD